MAKDYSQILTSYLKLWLPRLLCDKRFEIKNCFGAKAGYWKKNIFVSCGNFGLALKLPARTISNLLHNKEAKPLKYFEKGHVKKGYAVISPAVFNKKSRMIYLLKLSIKNVSG